MASTNFVDNNTVIVAAWLNDVNSAIYNILGNGTVIPATAAAARTNLGAAASGANSDITSLSNPAIGAATATTQSAGTNNTTVATTAFVQFTAPGRLLNVQVFTASGTYTPTAGTNKIIVEALGGGGGGGGCATTGASQVSVGGAGGAGAYAKGLITSAFSGATVTIGAAGTAGVAGNNAGGNGGSTSFNAQIVAGGGNGGGGGPAVAVPVGAGAIGTGGTASGTANLIAFRGMNGGNQLQTVTTASMSAQGGSSGYGSGGVAVMGTTATPGNNATGFGSGGSGGICAASQTQQAGGAGTAGFLIVWEYS